MSQGKYTRDHGIAALKLVHNQTEVITYLVNQVQQLKSDMFEKQERVIGLQEELIAAKNEQLLELKNTVVLSVSSVEDTDKT